MNDYDLIVIGAGSGGVRLARASAEKGAKVAIVESRYLGGSCVNVGCVPKKLLVYGAQSGEAIEDGRGYGWIIPKDQIQFDWQTLLANKNSEIERLNNVYGALLKNSNVDLIEGTGEIQDGHTVLVGDLEVTADRIAISTGSWPFIPDVSGKEHIISSNEMFFLDELPESILIWGGGYIGLEFAGIMNGLGVDTTVVFREDLVMRGFDTDVREFLTREMIKKGVQLLPNSNIESVQKLDSGELEATMVDGTTFTTDIVMAATGRKPLIDGLGLENTIVQTDAWGNIKVNEGFQTQEPSIYAIGDVIGTPQLTPVALAQATALSDRLFAGGEKSVNYDLIPTAVFCLPNIGTIGLSEDEARDQGYNVRVFKSNFKPMKYALAERNERCFMKMVVDADTDVVLGAHMVGDEAGEIIQGFAVAIRAGAKKSDFDNTVGIHPTVAEEFVTMQ